MLLPAAAAAAAAVSELLLAISDFQFFSFVCSFLCFVRLLAKYYLSSSAR